jgi:hypothetical protein
MNIGDSKIQRRASILLALGFILANTGNALASEFDAARGRGEAPDSRNRHGQYHPPRGGWVHTLPPGHRRYYYQGRPYYLHNGIWYARRPGGYFITRPPIGLYVSVPPPYHTTMWIGGSLYFYADDTYYRWVDARSAYEVVGRPPGADVPRLTSSKEEPAPSSFVYPRNGQSTEQQSTDRYECHTWSKGQTGFDPAQPGGGVAQDENGLRSSEYQRAVNACLEARGYSVK